MLIVHETARQQLANVIEFCFSNFAAKIPPDKIKGEAPCLDAQFSDVLQYLSEYANRPGCMYDRANGDDTRCTLYHDSAPLSFGFAMEYYSEADGVRAWRQWFNGGLIYHGPTLDAAGDVRCVENWAVDLVGGIGWSTHT